MEEYIQVSAKTKNEAITKAAIEPVSYTHLDVYKRQQVIRVFNLSSV